MPKTSLDTAPAPGAHPPAWLLEQLAFEPEAAGDEARRHQEGCLTCKSAVTELTEARRRFLVDRPAHRFAAGVEERSSREARPTAGWWPPRRWNARWLLVPAAAAAAVLLVLIIPLPSSRQDAVHVKGAGAVLRIFLSRGGQAARPMEPGMALRPGDVLRFGVVAPGARHAFVASVDEAGRFSRYDPAGDTAGAPLDGSGALQLLPGSVELDETTGREWIVLLLSPQPLGEEEVRGALLAAWRGRQGDRLGPLGLAAEAVVVPVVKVAR
ncbi:MAG TPA: hypothetical protein VFR85_02035 [Anaeromyxobacteraceae bacterium]|nr:hypothetical protein [Anaeromyxobacteraceae bacterium]